MPSRQAETAGSQFGEISGKMTEAHRQRKTGNFFGRRKSKPLRKAQAETYERLLSQLRIDIDTQPCGGLPALFRGLEPDSDIVLEIGFGGGEYLTHLAALHPETGFIGCEPFINGMAKALMAVDAGNLSNVRVFDEDAARLLDWLPAGSIDRVDLFYPDPWPKKRHLKRRFVSSENLDRIHRVLRQGREFRFASDIESYITWTLEHVAGHGGFERIVATAGDGHLPWAEWVSTRYEQKAIREGRRPGYLAFKRK
jgi:tRNA (guanine-N7-)-methyltransferase